MQARLLLPDPACTRQAFTIHRRQLMHAPPEPNAAYYGRRAITKIAHSPKAPSEYPSTPPYHCSVCNGSLRLRRRDGETLTVTATTRSDRQGAIPVHLPALSPLHSKLPSLPGRLYLTTPSSDKPLLPFLRLLQGPIPVPDQLSISVFNHQQMIALARTSLHASCSATVGQAGQARGFRAHARAAPARFPTRDDKFRNIF